MPYLTIKTAEYEILDPESLREGYFRLRDRVRTLLAVGELKRAFEIAEEAEEVARKLGDPALAAMARTNVAAVAIELGHGESYCDDLRTILMRNFNADVSYRSAVDLARAYEIQSNFKKALFYAKIAAHRAAEAQNPEFQTKSRILMGRLFVGDSQFEIAETTLEQALHDLPQGFVEFDIAQQNLGYCKVVLGKLAGGFRILFALLHKAVLTEKPYLEGITRASLSLACLQKGRIVTSWVHAQRALDIFEVMGHSDGIKKCLYLLGEVEAAAGDRRAALAWFRQVQTRFYPEHEQIPQLMARVGTLELVNLGA